MQAIIFIGAQASGKSSFYQDRFADSHVRINLDMLKTRRRERLLLEACLTMQQPFVIDNTHPRREDRARYMADIKAAGFSTTAYYFASRIAELLQRNACRPRVVPEKGVLATYSKLCQPSYDEGFETLYYVEMVRDGGFKVAEWQT